MPQTSRPGAFDRLRRAGQLGVLMTLTVLACWVTVALCARRAAAQYPVNVVQNILYNGSANGVAEYGDLYLPAASTGSLLQAVVVIHGGFWDSKSKTDPDIVLIAQTLAQNGIAAFSINYLLYDQRTPAIGSWPQNLEDCKTAVQWLRVNAATYGIDPNQIGVTGSSAGAHLAAMVAMTDATHGGFEPTAPYPGVSTAVQSAFLLYCPSVFISVPGKIAPFLGAGATQATETAATPVTYVRQGLPPMILVHGSADTVVPVLESFLFHSDLDGVGTLPGPGLVTWDNTSPFITYSQTPGFIEMLGLGHGFAIYDDGSADGFIYDLRPNMVQFFQQYLPVGVGATAR